MNNKHIPTFVYLMRNKANDKRYYGHTINWPSRADSHRNSLRRREHGNSLLQDDWEKYGESAFEFREVAALSNLHEAKRAEDELIRAYNTTDPDHGFNLMDNNKWSECASTREAERRLNRKREYGHIADIDDPEDSEQPPDHADQQ